MSYILDNLGAIKKLDSQNMLGSIERLGAQIEQVYKQAEKLKLPASYKKAKSIVVLGMGGSTLGAHVIKAAFFDKLKLPVEIVNGYHVPATVGRDTLVVVSSYSGTTEEPIAAMAEARRRQAKLAIITSGGKLAAAAKKFKIPALIFTTENNPCGSPRMGLGYLMFGKIILLAKAGLLKIGRSELSALLATIKRAGARFGVNSPSDTNPAKLAATALLGKSVWYVGAEHLGGNAHVAANQMNENAKRFAGYFLIPELNHHLLEGMKFPATNSDAIAFVLFESSLYDPRVIKRFGVTKEILQKNNIKFISFAGTEKKPLLQAAEALVFSSYASYYSALLEGIDPTAIPVVDYFKEALKK